MLTLLDLLSSIALLVWGTYIVRTGVMRAYGARLRQLLGNSGQHKSGAFFAGLGITALVQSSNATALLVMSFVSQGLIALPVALVVMLGADVGTALMARVLTFHLTWLSPLLILAGVILFLGQRNTPSGQMGRAAIGLGLIILALQMIISAAEPITHASGLKEILHSITGQPILDLLFGAVFAMISYSSLATVLFSATLTATGMVSLKVAFCLVIGANIGSGFLALLGSHGQGANARRVALGNLIFKGIGGGFILPWLSLLAAHIPALTTTNSVYETVIYFHVTYNIVLCLMMLPLTNKISQWCIRLIPEEKEKVEGTAPRYLDRSALDTPSLALANAVRETLRLAEILQQMLDLFAKTLQGEGQVTREISRRKEDIEGLYSEIKLYLTQLQPETMAPLDARRWAEVLEHIFNLQQASDIIEHMSADIALKSLDLGKPFSSEGEKELLQLYLRLQDNEQLSAAIFLSGDMTQAKRLRRAKHRFNLLCRNYSYAHLARLHQQNAQSLGTSNLHLGLIGEMRRVNSLLCAVAYHVLGTETSSAMLQAEK